MEQAPVLRLLIADDHQLFADALRVALASETVDVVGIAGTGREAVDLALTLAPDILLLDLGLPELDGFETLRLLREQRSLTRTIVLSGQDVPANKQRAIELGALAFVSKAQPLEELSDAVEAAAALVRAVDLSLDDA